MFEETRRGIVLLFKVLCLLFLRLPELQTSSEMCVDNLIEIYNSFWQVDPQQFFFSKMALSFVFYLYIHCVEFFSPLSFPHDNFSCKVKLADVSSFQEISQDVKPSQLYRCCFMSVINVAEIYLFNCKVETSQHSFCTYWSFSSIPV